MILGERKPIYADLFKSEEKWLIESLISLNNMSKRDKINLYWNRKKWKLIGKPVESERHSRELAE